MSQIITLDAEAPVVSMVIFSLGDVSAYLIFLSLIYDSLKLLVPFILGVCMLDNLNLFLYAFKCLSYLQIVSEPEVAILHISKHSN